MLGVTGSGKTFTMAKVIEKVQRPTLVLAHNKTLAAQLCAEFKEFFPNNAVEYFVSYYDYYQPEAYIPHTDTYIEKDASTNDEIDRLRLSATCALLERRDVIVVSSVSCIYGLGEPDDFAKMVISLRQWGGRGTGTSCCAGWWRTATSGTTWPLSGTCSGSGGTRWRSTPPTIRITPSGWSSSGTRSTGSPRFNPVTGTANRVLNHVAIYPASHYVTTKEKMDRAIQADPNGAGGAGEILQ